MASLTKPELGVIIDLTGVTEFIVKANEGSRNFAVTAVFTSREQAVMWDEDWDRAHLYRTQLQKHVIDEGKDVTINEDTGSIVPV
jgi:hypothetical protein